LYNGQLYDRTVPARLPSTVDVMTTRPSDEALAWSLAANCRLYEEDPGPPEVNVGSDTEKRLVSRTDAWRDYYARQLLLGLDAQRSRLEALTDQCRSGLAATKKRRHWFRLIIARLREPGSLSGRLRFAAELLDKHEREQMREVHRCAVDLCDRAAQVLEESGAVDDESVRRRLVAGLEHQMTVETLGIIPGFSKFSAERLNERLREFEE